MTEVTSAEDGGSGDTAGVDSSEWLFLDGAPENAAGDELTLAMMIAVLGVTSGARGLWRSWCVEHAASGTDGAAVAVYLVESDEGTVTELDGALRNTVSEHGDGTARIETVPVGAELSRFQRDAWLCGELLWAADPELPIGIAPTFGGDEPGDGPGFSPDHPRITDDFERHRMLEFLCAAPVLPTTEAMTTDVVSPERGRVVPADVRTDGNWIWSRAVEYYLETYGLAPYSGLVTHIAADSRGPSCPDLAAQHRAMAELRARGGSIVSADGFADPEPGADQQQENWFLLMDPQWTPDEQGVPPIESVMGVWPVDESGVVADFRPNPDYHPTDDSSPTDPIDAVLRQIVAGNTEVEHVQPLLRDTEFDLALNGDGRPLIIPSPDDVPCAVIATAVSHRARIPSPMWSRAALVDLIELFDEDTDLLINIEGPAAVRLPGDFVRAAHDLTDEAAAAVYAAFGEDGSGLAIRRWDVSEDESGDAGSGG